MRHIEGDVVRPRDCILLRASCKRNESPFVAKVAHLWENPEDGIKYENKIKDANFNKLEFLIL
jgi:hypothetical protein